MKAGNSVSKTNSNPRCVNCGKPGVKTNSRSQWLCRKCAEGRIKPVRRGGKTPSRNERCPCGSGAKYKKCCGKPKNPAPRTSPYTNFAGQYKDEQRAAHRAFVTQWGFEPNPAQLMTFMEGDPDEIKSMVVRALRRLEERTGSDNSRFIHGVLQLGRLITPLNQGMVDDAANQEWADTLAAYQEQHVEREQSTPDSSG